MKPPHHRLTTLPILLLILALWGEALGQPAAATDDVGVPGPFTFANVVRRAQALAGAQYERVTSELPEVFAQLDYDGYRDIRFRAEQSLWHAEGLPFQVQFFHRGFMFHDRVGVNVIDGAAVLPVHFSQEMFDYGTIAVPAQLSEELGFAGLRLLYPLNRDDFFDEVVVFLGASYFRAVAQGLNYGITARGLAIDTGLATKEEFPLFREFWLVKAAPEAVEITLYALLDSPSIAGAYRFVVRPGQETVVDVKAHLYLREGVKKLGIAPLTSMFHHGEVTERFVDDFRPAVHDSDGLIVETGTGERIWRPLVNPASLRIGGFAVENPKLFGLLQRNRAFSSYEDLEAYYHNRPAAQVEPAQDWGEGTVELVEIPSDSERYDNIVAYWVPAKLAEAGDELEVAYRLRFAGDPEQRLTGGRALATRIGAGGSAVLDPSQRKFVIDFAGEHLAALDPQAEVAANVATSSGKLSSPVVQYNPYTRGRRLFFELTPERGRPAQLRAFLYQGADVLSETWSFEWTPQ